MHWLLRAALALTSTMNAVLKGCSYDKIKSYEWAQSCLFTKAGKLVASLCQKMMSKLKGAKTKFSKYDELVFIQFHSGTQSQMLIFNKYFTKWQKCQPSGVWNKCLYKLFTETRGWSWIKGVDNTGINRNFRTLDWHQIKRVFLNRSG